MKRAALPFVLLLAAGVAKADDVWSFKTSIGHVVSNESAKAKVKYADEDLFEMSAGQIKLRLNPRLQGDETETAEFRLRNTSIWLPLEIDGKDVLAGCDPDEDSAGTFKRTELSNERVSGTFMLTLVKCDDYYSAAPLAYEGLPFTVEGDFSLKRR